MILGLIDATVAAGARLDKACEVVGVDPRTLQRWKSRGIGADLRAGPKQAPKNKLSPQERAQILEVVNSPEHRDLSPKQIVPKLADEGVYIGSESTMYRMLREEGQMKHRECSRPPSDRSRPGEHVATAPKQVWSWDITYLRSPILGVFFYLYVVLDVWSRKIVGWSVHEEESAEHASAMIQAACVREGIRRDQLVLHSDNGGPMKGATLLATLQVLGVAASFSRPRVSDDNPFSEALFRTTKYRPEFPRRPFASLEAARQWVTWFVRWYNTEHRHSAIRFVTPEERHSGRDAEILANRHLVYAAARERRPERWARNTRNWTPIEAVALNPTDNTSGEEAA
jgi:transposase InsO family protein